MLPHPAAPEGATQHKGRANGQRLHPRRAATPPRCARSGAMHCLKVGRRFLRFARKPSPPLMRWHDTHCTGQTVQSRYWPAAAAGRMQRNPKPGAFLRSWPRPPMAGQLLDRPAVAAHAHIPSTHALSPSPPSLPLSLPLSLSRGEVEALFAPQLVRTSGTSGMAGRKEEAEAQEEGTPAVGFGLSADGIGPKRCGNGRPRPMASVRPIIPLLSSPTYRPTYAHIADVESRAIDSQRRANARSGVRGVLGGREEHTSTSLLACI